MSTFENMTLDLNIYNVDFQLGDDEKLYEVNLIESLIEEHVNTQLFSEPSETSLTQEERDFLEFLEPLEVSLEEFCKDNAIKKSEAKEKGQGKKRKSDPVGSGQENVDAAEVARVLKVQPPSNDNDASPTKEGNKIGEGDLMQDA